MRFQQSPEHASLGWEKRAAPTAAPLVCCAWEEAHYTSSAFSTFAFFGPNGSPFHYRSVMEPLPTIHLEFAISRRLLWPRRSALISEDQLQCELYLPVGSGGGRNYAECRRCCPQK